MGCANSKQLETVVVPVSRAYERENPLRLRVPFHKREYVEIIQAHRAELMRHVERRDPEAARAALRAMNEAYIAIIEDGASGYALLPKPNKPRPNQNAAPDCERPSSGEPAEAHLS